MRAKEMDIFESGCDMLVNPVNCVGVAGAGLALEFREKFPNNFRAYRSACLRKELSPGGVLVLEPWPDKTPLIANFATKLHWRDKSRLDYIKTGLGTLRSLVDDRQDIQSVAIPALGCGLGGLDFIAVQGEILRAFRGCQKIYRIYPPMPLIYSPN